MVYLLPVLMLDVIKLINCLPAPEKEKNLDCEQEKEACSRSIFLSKFSFSLYWKHFCSRSRAEQNRGRGSIALTS